MSDEIVICKGQVVGVNGSYQSDGTVDVDDVRSMLLVDKHGFNTDLDTHRYNNSDSPSSITVKGRLDYGAVYEFVMRPVKKPAPQLAEPTGQRLFKGNEGE